MSHRGMRKTDQTTEPQNSSDEHTTKEKNPSLSGRITS